MTVQVYRYDQVEDVIKFWKKHGYRKTLVRVPDKNKGENSWVDAVIEFEKVEK